MVISDCTVGMGITGSFCSFEKTKDVAKRLVDSFTHVDVYKRQEVYPI